MVFSHPKGRCCESEGEVPVKSPHLRSGCTHAQAYRGYPAPCRFFPAAPSPRGVALRRSLPHALVAIRRCPVVTRNQTLTLDRTSYALFQSRIAARADSAKACVSPGLFSRRASSIGPLPEEVSRKGSEHPSRCNNFAWLQDWRTHLWTPLERAERAIWEGRTARRREAPSTGRGGHLLFFIQRSIRSKLTTARPPGS